MWTVSLPVQRRSGRGPGALDLARSLGVGAVWSVGLCSEAVGDVAARALQGRSRERGQVMDRGLWRYTRHPNYFGDCCVWWGLWLIASPPGAGWCTRLGPLVMTILLRQVSGVADARGHDHRADQRRTRRHTSRRAPVAIVGMALPQVVLPGSATFQIGFDEVPPE